MEAISAAADDPESYSPPPERLDSLGRQKPEKVRHLTAQDELAVMTLHKTGKLTQDTIAQQIGCSQAAVSRTIRRYTPTLEHARTILEAGAAQASKNWIRASAKGAERGRHEPSRDLLAAVGVVDLSPQTAVGVQVIVNASPGQPLAQVMEQGHVISGNVLGSSVDTQPESCPALSPPTFAPDVSE